MVLQMFLLPVSLKDRNGRRNQTRGLAAFSLQPSTSLHIEVVFNHNSQFKGSFSTVEFLCPTEGCWDPGLLLSHNKELMAGQIPKGFKAQLAPSHIEELTCQQGLAEIC